MSILGMKHHHSLLRSRSRGTNPKKLAFGWLDSSPLLAVAARSARAEQRSQTPRIYEEYRACLARRDREHDAAL